MSVLVRNRKARFDYNFIETHEAGVQLFGYEVKALRAGQGKLEGGHILIRGGEAYLVGITIQSYQPANTPADYDPERPRRLLLTRKQLSTLVGIDAHKELTMVPMSLYTKGRYIKLEFAVVRGKKRYDKREILKKRAVTRDIDRVMKMNNR